MNWIELDDSTRIQSYAVAHTCDQPMITPFPRNIKSYYHDCSSTKNGIAEIQNYQPYGFSDVRDTLERLWHDRPLEAKKLLIDIVSVAILKHEPFPVLNEKTPTPPDSSDNYMNKETQLEQKVLRGDVDKAKIVSSLIYEF